ncbi:MAG: hypothetical protein DWP97_01860 [Calditrichaeota bacterium]|nr:MAG: hypothetical protein DWP97_01860 [Calditrichota bacterium]
MKKLLLFIILCCFISSAKADNFDKLKVKLSKTPCISFELLSVIESDIFESVDTTYSEAIISMDGRYSIKAGDEEYNFDRNLYYTYSKSNNQVILEKSYSEANDNVIFLTKLDELYKSYILTPDLKYKLVKVDSIESDSPDSLIIELQKKKAELKQIQFYDINEDLNRLIFLKQNYLNKCSDSIFTPVYPDSVDVVKL